MSNDTGSSLVQPQGSLREMPREKSSGGFFTKSDGRLTTAAGRAASVAFLTGAITHHREIPAIIA